MVEQENIKEPDPIQEISEGEVEQWFESEDEESAETPASDKDVPRSVGQPTSNCS